MNDWKKNDCAEASIRESNVCAEHSENLRIW